MTTPPKISDADLGALADGQLSPERAAAVEAAVARDADAQARLATIRAQNAALAGALDPWLAEPIPPRLLTAATPPGRARGGAKPWRAAVALVATLVLGVAVGWFAREALLASHGTPTTFAREAAFSHAIYAGDPGRPVEISGAEEARLMRWLGRRLGVEITPPDLTAVGFSLVGGRLVAGNAKPMALLMYENPAKQRLTLQWRKNENANEAAFRYAHENGVGVFYWIDENCAYALSGNVERERLFAIARVVHAQLAAAYAQHLQR
jgi:anti-sigma factor RsiW